MAFADLQLPTRLLAGGGPSTPDARVLRALTTPPIGQFDPDFTAVMDDVTQLARLTFLTTYPRCFAVSALASGGLEAVLNSLLEVGERVAIGGGPGFVTKTADIARRCGASVVSAERLAQRPKLLVVPFVDPTLGSVLAVQELAKACHAQGVRLVVDATLGLGACELRVDDWSVDVCVAGVDCGVGAPPGMALITYSPECAALLEQRQTPPRTSYLDLGQLQAYWSADRLNHHTAPTSLIYGLREALRLMQDEGLTQRWLRHREIGQRLRDGLTLLGLEISGDLPFSVVHLPTRLDERSARLGLLEHFGVYVTQTAPRTWRVGLLGADARLDAVNRVVSAFERVLAA
jgi:aspartate aminotransferase-like enzyme